MNWSDFLSSLKDSRKLFSYFKFVQSVEPNDSVPIIDAVGHLDPLDTCRLALSRLSRSFGITIQLIKDPLFRDVITIYYLLIHCTDIIISDLTLDDHTKARFIQIFPDLVCIGLGKEPTQFIDNIHTLSPLGRIIPSTPVSNLPSSDTLSSSSSSNDHKTRSHSIHKDMPNIKSALNKNTTTSTNDDDIPIYTDHMTLISYIEQGLIGTTFDQTCLLQCLDLVLLSLHVLPTIYHNIVLSTLYNICFGYISIMTNDNAFMQYNNIIINTIEQYDMYCYILGGLPCMGFTQLYIAHHNAHLATSQGITLPLHYALPEIGSSQYNNMIELSCNVGIFSQKVSIIRDFSSQTWTASTATLSPDDLLSKKDQLPSHLASIESQYHDTSSSSSQQSHKNIDPTNNNNDNSINRIFWPRAIWSLYIPHLSFSRRYPYHTRSILCLRHMIVDALRHAINIPSWLAIFQNRADPIHIPHPTLVHAHNRLYNSGNSIFTKVYTKDDIVDNKKGNKPLIRPISSTCDDDKNLIDSTYTSIHPNTTIDTLNDMKRYVNPDYDQSSSSSSLSSSSSKAPLSLSTTYNTNTNDIYDPNILLFASSLSIIPLSTLSCSIYDNGCIYYTSQPPTLHHMDLSLYITQCNNITNVYGIIYQIISSWSNTLTYNSKYDLQKPLIHNSSSGNGIGLLPTYDNILSQDEYNKNKSLYTTLHTYLDNIKGQTKYGTAPKKGTNIYKLCTMIGVTLLSSFLALRYYYTRPLSQDDVEYAALLNFDWDKELDVDTEELARILDLTT